MFSVKAVLLEAVDNVVPSYFSLDRMGENIIGKADASLFFEAACGTLSILLLSMKALICFWTKRN